jgi:hypothetical protein
MTHPTAASQQAVRALLRRLDRIAASADTLRAMTDHTGGTGSPSLPPLLRDLERDLSIAARELATVRAACAPTPPPEA